MTATSTLGPSKACREDQHDTCTGRASQGTRVSYSVAHPCPCRCHAQALLREYNARTATTETAQRADDAADVRQAADLLYDTTDPRASPWPDPQTLGRLRSHLRNLADWLDAETA
jgi:hypothetical protein